MTLIQYQEYRFRDATIDMIADANGIIAEYAKQGFDLTLRQLYYQFVARDLIPNQQSEYKRLGGVVNDARLAGLISWTAIVDRTRNLKRNSHWTSPAALIKQASGWYGEDCWKDQKDRVEVWIEKDALIGVIEGVCSENDCAFFSCRGYTSQSEMWVTAQRLIQYQDRGQRVHIIHLGDHDPSGIDMSRDIEDRLKLFANGHGFDGPTIHRIALNMDQVLEHNPPPNPTKLTDSRAPAYIANFGNESWELDALNPATLATLIREKIHELRDTTRWNAAVDHEQAGKDKLLELSGSEVLLDD